MNFKNKLEPRQQFMICRKKKVGLDVRNDNFEM